MAKIKIEDIRKEIEQEGWKLISTEYINLKTPLELECPQGHQVDYAYNDWRKDEVHECPLCSRASLKKLNETSKKKGYRILSLDQSTHVSGWSLTEDGILIRYGHWESKAREATQRIYEVKNWLDHLIETLHPDEVILEDIQLEREEVVTFKILAQLQGVLINYLYDSGIPYKVVFPNTWRGFSSIKGVARTEKKKSAQLKVDEFYGIKVSIDEAEAILIGRWAAHNKKNNDIIDF